MEWSALLPSTSPVTLLFTLLFLALSYPLSLFLYHAILLPYHRHRQLSAQGLKGPPFKPLIGDLLMIRRYSDDFARLKMGEDNRRDYGKNFHFMLGPFNMLSLGDPDYVLAAWKTQNQHYSKVTQHTLRHHSTAPPHHHCTSLDPSHSHPHTTVRSCVCGEV